MTFVSCASFGSLSASANRAIAARCNILSGFSLETTTNNEGNFSVENTIGYGEMPGTWDIEITAESPDGKRGIKELSTKIDFPAGVSYYFVNFSR